MMLSIHVLKILKYKMLHEYRCWKKLGHRIHNFRNNVGRNLLQSNCVQFSVTLIVSFMVKHMRVQIYKEMFLMNHNLCCRWLQWEECLSL